MQQEQQDVQGSWFDSKFSRRQRSLLIFWGCIALLLLVGLEQIFANPDSTSNTMRGSVVISEFGAAGSGPMDEYGNRPDWIELYNRTLLPISLENWMLTDDPEQPDKWVFGDITIEPGTYMIVFASGRDQDELDEDELFLHTNFRLNSNGGFLALYPPTARQFVDGTAFDYPAQSPLTSYALVQDESGVWLPRYLASPTPGEPNDISVTWAGVLPPVEFSVPHGFYNSPFVVGLQSPVEDARIVYTTDGSTPSESNGTPYTRPIQVEKTTLLRAVALLPDYAPSLATTQSYFFQDEILQQPADPDGWPSTWGIHSLTRGNAVAGEPVEADYAMDARVVNDPSYGDALIEGLLELPTVSLVTDMANFDIYAMPQARGREFERPVSVEWIDPNGEDGGFQINAGIRIQGNAGRLEYMPKHSFRLFFRQIYGASKLNYPIFDESYVSEFETLTLRGGVNYGFAGDYTELNEGHLRDRTTYLRDEWARASQIAVSNVGSHGNFVHLYINGLYWGLYNLVERPDASFAASYLGGDEEDWGSANHGGLVSGEPDRFWVLGDLALEGGMEDPARYATLLEFFDPAQFSDYVILNWYAGNDDWPETNWYAAVHNPAGRNYFFVWDAESIWDGGAIVDLGGETPELAAQRNIVKHLFEAAWANPDFRMVFADRLYRNLYNDGALTDAKSIERWQTLQARIEKSIVAESARWGDSRYDEPISLENWQSANRFVLDQMDGNAKKLIQLARDNGYYPLIDPPLLSPFGGEFSGEQQVTLEIPATAMMADVDEGIIYYTIDGSDPRAAQTGEVSPSAQVYDAAVVLTTTSVLKARLWVDGVWSALSEARFAESSEAPHVVISEIMYNPYLDENMEFIELKNVGNTAADLSGAYFDGIGFRFGEGTTLAPGQHVVLIRSLRNFRQRYPEALIYGQYTGKLSDKGETITLYHPTGELWLEVAYDDDYGWPLSADGAGDSLVLVDPMGDLNSPHNWRASGTLYGTPGEDEP